MELPDVGFEELILYITGPTYIRPDVMLAGLYPVFGHRDTEATKRLEPSMRNLKRIAEVGDGYRVVLIPGTGSNAMESSIRSLVRDDEKVLCVSVGEFGDLYHKMATTNGKKAELLRFDSGQSIDMNQLDDNLRRLRPAVVAMTHNETSTGVVNDVAAASRLARSYGALPLVDGVSIFGGAHSHIEEADIAIYSTSTQKCLGLPAGLGIAIVSGEALEKAKSVENRGYTTDILAHADSAAKFQTLTTTPTQLANQLFYQTGYIVEQEGVETRFRRHEKMRDLTHEWVRTLPDGFGLFTEPGAASPTLTCIRVPESLDRDALKEAMRARGYLFDPGYKKMKVPTIRIGHMGDITPDMLREYLSSLRMELDQML